MAQDKILGVGVVKEGGSVLHGHAFESLTAAGWCGTMVIARRLLDLAALGEASSGGCACTCLCRLFLWGDESLYALKVAICTKSCDGADGLWPLFESKALFAWGCVVQGHVLVSSEPGWACKGLVC